MLDSLGHVACRAFVDGLLCHTISKAINPGKYCIRHIFRKGIIFANFVSRVVFANSTTVKTNLPPIPTQECDLCIYAILVVQYTVHVQMSEWYWFLRPPSMIALLLDREFNHSRKCLEVPIREKLDSRNIWRIQYSFNHFFPDKKLSRPILFKFDKVAEQWNNSKSRNTELAKCYQWQPFFQMPSSAAFLQMGKWWWKLM